MRQIAFYGKGGSGKSTIVSNLSATLAREGKKVLQVGCDPKQDSTRSLLAGVRPVTAVELLQKKSRDKITPQELVNVSAFGIDCIEAGGPEPGAGCAGLGIIKTLELVASLKLYDRGYDYVFFDVLGDVVCGGFATPMRMKFADEVYVVVSGEMMSLYAANNICRGVLKHASSGDVRLGGFVGNQRNPGAPTETVYDFAREIGSKIIGFIPWSAAFIEAEKKAVTVVENGADPNIVDLFRELSNSIANNDGLVVPKPMSVEEFDLFYSGGRKAAKE